MTVFMTTHVSTGGWLTERVQMIFIVIYILLNNWGIFIKKKKILSFKKRTVPGDIVVIVEQTASHFPHVKKCLQIRWKRVLKAEVIPVLFQDKLLLRCVPVFLIRIRSVRVPTWGVLSYMEEAPVHLSAVLSGSVCRPHGGFPAKFSHFDSITFAACAFLPSSPENNRFELAPRGTAGSCAPRAASTAGANTAPVPPAAWLPGRGTSCLSGSARDTEGQLTDWETCVCEPEPH